ncbi:TPA: hypothetical protein ACN310_004597 [Vibrio parahaemolyticus]|uniref:hypothetical protein n=1 Tax=Vibrio parahaemolyticus TaxID=670 RepID=UPI000977D02D|nr:hypothetical protein [Vibrio parahaemolyticus]EJE4701600.1 hypothetical protein [Vibrio parahaemolyticus]ELA9555393.1 hypothetical protein [Vibrio parahaemolyticus]OMP47831.1 hypothetical protein BBM19_22830 [Vibrio parahaemolyticus]TXM30270.1 hypothetical protein FVP00_23410 [Vibrio parahaemolyticus]
MFPRSVSLPNIDSLTMHQPGTDINQFPILSVRSASIEKMPLNLITIDHVEGIKLNAVRIGLETPIASMAVEVDRHSKERIFNVGLKVFGFGAQFGMAYVKVPNTKKSKEKNMVEDSSTWL